MADTFYIQYSASATPIEEIEGVDSTNKARIVHSSIDKSVGGGKEITSGTTATDVRYSEVTTTESDVTLNTISGATLTAIDFVMIKIKEGIDADGDCDVIVSIGVQQVSKLVKVGDVVLLRPNAIAGSALKVKSSSGKTCKIEILYGKEA